MKFNILLIIFTVEMNAQSWVQLPDFPGTERDDGVAFVIANKAYCLSGLDVNFNCTANGFVFNGTTETWVPMAPLPAGEERQYATAFSYAGSGYVLGGINGSNLCLNDFWKYDPLADSWTALPDFPGTARQGMSNFIIKNNVYIAGGKLADGTILNDLWQYDFLTSSWIQKNNLPVNGMWRGSAFTIDTVAYIAYGANNSQSYNHNMYAYNHQSDAWAQLPGINLPARRYVGTAVCANGAGLYGGQDSIGNIVNELRVFDALDHSLIWRPGIPTFGRKGGMAFSLNGQFYTTTGVTNAARVKETWKAVNFVGIENHKPDHVVLYPNPAENVIHISIASFVKENAIMEVYNTLGELSLSVPFSETLDVSALQQGMYVMFIKSKAQRFQSRFVK
jgi:N-acetylneuraminic acid mutarotase